MTYPFPTMSDTHLVLLSSSFTGSSSVILSAQADGTREARSGNAAQLYLLTLGTEQGRYRVARILDAIACSFGFADLSNAPC